MDVRHPKAFDALLDAVLGQAELSNPWSSPTTYVPDIALLARLLSIPVRQAAAQESGRFAKASDLWVAHELRRAGFGEDEVWPRRTRPRVLPQALAPLEKIVKVAGGKVPANIR